MPLEQCEHALARVVGHPEGVAQSIGIPWISPYGSFTVEP